MENHRYAFVLRINPSGDDRVEEALHDDHAIIGWAKAAELLDPDLSWEDFREVVRRHYYAKDPNMRAAGAAGGHLWRFLRDMKPGDLVVVPHGPEFYVGEVTGPALHDRTKVEDGTAFRRPVRWLNDKHPIPRTVARAALQSRMKAYGTSADATDLIEEIEECLRSAKRAEQPTFSSDLEQRLVREALSEIQSGRLDPFGFESLVKSVLEGLGAQEARIIARSQDKGADILATFRVAGAFSLVVAVQAKHYQPDPPIGRDVVDQLIRGIEAETANLGMIVTSGSISADASGAAREYFESSGIKIELVDGPQLASLIVQHGLRKT